MTLCEFDWKEFCYQIYRFKNQYKHLVFVYLIIYSYSSYILIIRNVNIDVSQITSDILKKTILINYI